MRVLVTGHQGYIGSVMVAVLQRAGHEVVGLDSGLFEECRLGPPDPPAVSLRSDVRDVTEGDLGGVDAVVHLAALSNDPLGELDPALTHAINYEASVRLASLARQAGVQRFLFSSSCSIYGDAGGGASVNEESPLRPLTAYAVSKVRAEEALRGLSDSDFSPVFLRNATAYGLSPRFRADLVLNNLTAWALATGKVRLLSDGTPWRPLVHVEDLCYAFACVLAAPREAVHDQAFNVGVDSENYPIGQLAEIVQETVRGSAIEMAGQAGGDARSYRVDFSKLARAIPAFRPRWTAQLGARQVYEALRDRGFGSNELLAGVYERLPYLRRLRESGTVDASLRWAVCASDRGAPRGDASQLG